MDSVIPLFRRLRQEGGEFNDRVGYIGDCFKKNPTKQTKQKGNRRF
jgi:hypothetical protein